MEASPKTIAQRQRAIREYKEAVKIWFDAESLLVQARSQLTELGWTDKQINDLRDACYGDLLI